MSRVLDALRAAFVYIVAALLPLAGVVLAIIRFAQDDRREASLLATAAFLGVCVYALVLG